MLIDADADDYLFRENFLNDGLEGGKHAANELYAGIVGYLKSINVNADSLDIVVRAYASFSGLQVACMKKALLKSDGHISKFAHGFTQRRGLFDFVDVGPGKERADFKIKGLDFFLRYCFGELLTYSLIECLDLFVNDFQCKHIIVGACQDAGYAPYLSNFASDSAIRDKISLIEGGTMHASFKDLGFPRKPLKLENVFAPAKKVVTGTSMLPSSVRQEATASSRQHIEERQDMLVNVEAQALAGKLRPIRDSDGRRVDKVLDVDPASSYLKALRKANLCGYYYLRGQCDGRCGRQHGIKPLNSHEFDCLWYVLRQAGQCYKFRQGNDCEDPLCYYGHQVSSQ